MKSGQDYIEITKSISIWITNYNVFEDGPFHERARLRRDYENKVLTDSLELHYIQLPKFKEKCKRISSKLEEWLIFIINENMEAIEMSENENIKKAEEEFEYLTGDEETKRLAYLREKAIRDEAWAKATALKRGRAEGEQKAKFEIAKNLLKKNIAIETIMEVTGLTREEIEKL